MIRKCNLSFVENSVLTKEMLSQMNSEPKWLILEDRYRDLASGDFIENGIISGFCFYNRSVDDYSVMTKGNIFIKGSWYRMEEDYVFDADKLGLVSSTTYCIVFSPDSNDSYEVNVKIECQADDILFAKFNYEFDPKREKRVFRVASKMQDFTKKYAFLYGMAIPYYNMHGVAICPPHVTVLLKDELSKKRRSFKEEIFYQRLLNENEIAVASVYDLLGKKSDDLVLTDRCIEDLYKYFNHSSSKSYDEDDDDENEDSVPGSKIGSKPKHKGF